MKKKKNDLQISLFPFLSILACVIGILTLMITAIVIAQIDPEAVNEKIETALDDDEEFKKKIAEQKKELEKLRQEIKSIKANPKKPLDPKRKEQLRQEIAKVAKEAEKRNLAKKESQALQGQVVKMKDDLAELMKDLEEAEEEWELMKDPEKFATMVVKQSGSGAGGDLEPTFIECRAEGLRVYEGAKVSFELKTSQISKDAKFQNLIKKVAREAPYRTWVSSQGTPMDARYVKRDGLFITLKDKNGKEIKVQTTQLSRASQQIARKYEDARKAERPDPSARYVIFLIRGKGTSAWSQASRVCAQQGCKYGQLPLDGEGEIDLSLFSGS